MRVILFLFIFLNISCTKWADVQEANGIHKIEELEAQIHSLSTREWKVGQQRGTVVSKGIAFKVDIPKISEQGRDLLYKKYGVDSWIYKISRVYRGRARELGYIRFDLANISRLTEDITVHVFYHAASVSKQFRNFHCPAFDHRFIIDDYELDEDDHEIFNIYVRGNQSIRGKVSKPAFTPLIFSGGKSLKGTYQVEIALYNSKQKRTYSQFEKIGNTIEVEDENRVAIPSCIGVKEENKPLPQSKTPNIRDLEIK